MTVPDPAVPDPAAPNPAAPDSAVPELRGPHPAVPGPSDPDPPPGERSATDLRAQMREQMLTGLGGWTGMLMAAIPTVVFVVVNAITTLRVAVAAAVASALLLAAYRWARDQPVQQAFSGLFGVLIAAAIAAGTGQARGYFLFGILQNLAYAVAFLVSIVVRRPLVGIVWEFLDPTPSDRVLADESAAEVDRPQDPDLHSPVPPWYRRPLLARAYLLATLAGFVVFAARSVVQLRLFEQNATGWLAVARISMGYPLTIAAVAFAWFMVRRARARLRLDARAA